MARDPHEMSDAELAEWQYAHRQELDAEEGELVDADISPQLSVTLSFRLPGTEADAIRQAADQAGMTLSEWIRQACAEALNPTADRVRRQTVDEELAFANDLIDLLAQRIRRATTRNRTGSDRRAGTSGT